MKPPVSGTVQHAQLWHVQAWNPRSQGLYNTHCSDMYRHGTPGLKDSTTRTALTCTGMEHPVSGTVQHAQLWHVQAWKPRSQGQYNTNCSDMYRHGTPGLRPDSTTRTALTCTGMNPRSQAGQYNTHSSDMYRHGTPGLRPDSTTRTGLTCTGMEPPVSGRTVQHALVWHVQAWNPRSQAWQYNTHCSDMYRHGTPGLRDCTTRTALTCTAWNPRSQGQYNTNCSDMYRQGTPGLRPDSTTRTGLTCTGMEPPVSGRTVQHAQLWHVQAWNPRSQGQYNTHSSDMYRHGNPGLRDSTTRIALTCTGKEPPVSGRTVQHALLWHVQAWNPRSQAGQYNTHSSDMYRHGTPGLRDSTTRTALTCTGMETPVSGTVQHELLWHVQARNPRSQAGQYNTHCSDMYRHGTPGLRPDSATVTHSYDMYRHGTTGLRPDSTTRTALTCTGMEPPASGRTVQHALVWHVQAWNPRPQAGQCNSDAQLWHVQAWNPRSQGQYNTHCSDMYRHGTPSLRAAHPNVCCKRRTLHHIALPTNKKSTEANNTLIFITPRLESVRTNNPKAGRGPEVVGGEGGCGGKLGRATSCWATGSLYTAGGLLATTQPNSSFLSTPMSLAGNSGRQA